MLCLLKRYFIWGTEFRLIIFSLKSSRLVISSRFLYLIMMTSRLRERAWRATRRWLYSYTLKTPLPPKNLKHDIYLNIYSGFNFSHSDLPFPTRCCIPYVRSGLYQLVIRVKGFRVCALHCEFAITSITHCIIRFCPSASTPRFQ